MFQSPKIEIEYVQCSECGKLKQTHPFNAAAKWQKPPPVQQHLAICGWVHCDDCLRVEHDTMIAEASERLRLLRIRAKRRTPPRPWFASR